MLCLSGCLLPVPCVGLIMTCICMLTSHGNPNLCSVLPASASGCLCYTLNENMRFETSCSCVENRDPSAGPGLFHLGRPIGSMHHTSTKMEIRIFAAVSLAAVPHVASTRRRCEQHDPSSLDGLRCSSSDSPPPITCQAASSSALHVLGLTA
jgi:hypothetical protein